MHWSSFVPESSVVVRAAAVLVERRLPLVQSYLYEKRNKEKLYTENR